MKPPEQDIENRKPVWDVLQMIYMDTDVDLELPYIARICAASPYSLEELKDILFKEVFPACRSNFYYPVAPEWKGYQIDWLTQTILKKQRHGKTSRLILFHAYTASYWRKLEQQIRKIREDEQSATLEIRRK